MYEFFSESIFSLKVWDEACSQFYDSGNLHISFKVGEASYENMVVQSNFHLREKMRACIRFGCLKTIFNLKYELLQFHEHFQSPVNIFCLASKFFVFKEMIVFVLPQKMNRLELTLQVNCGPHFFSQKLRNLLIRSCFYRFEVGGRYDIILLIRSCFGFKLYRVCKFLKLFVDCVIFFLKSSSQSSTPINGSWWRNAWIF